MFVCGLSPLSLLVLRRSLVVLRIVSAYLSFVIPQGTRTEDFDGVSAVAWPARATAVVVIGTYEVQTMG